MGTVANSNFGFKGTVSSAETPQVLGNGSLYSVAGKGDLKVTAGGTGDRAVTVAAGAAWGDAVLSKWTTGANLNCAANSTGATRYDTVVIRRAWTPAGTPTGTATLMVLTGGSSGTIAATRTTDRGVTTSDQPIALVPVPTGSAVVGTPSDLRCWTGEGGGLVAEALGALQYMGSKGSQVQIGSVVYTRLEDGAGTLYWERTAPLPAAYETFGSVVPGITVPTSALPTLDGKTITKTGKTNFFTTTAFGNEYGQTVTFAVPFPTACLSVSVTQLQVAGGPTAFAGAVALDSVQRGSFRVVYPGGTTPTNRAFLYQAVGY